MTRPDSASTHRGTLLMLSTHIGNIDDMPSRSINALKEADLLVFEEDRPARRALKAAKVHREYLKFSEHVQKETLDHLRKCLKKGGTVAYMSDQGCPVLADPGFPVLSLAWELGSLIKVIPGPSSLTAALSACPFPVSDFYFAGFLPRTSGARMDKIKELSLRKESVIVMDTPYRLGDLLQALSEGIGKNRKGFVALDISGPEEAWHTGTLPVLAQQFKGKNKKLNFVLVLEGLRSQSQSRKPLKQNKKV